MLVDASFAGHDRQLCPSRPALAPVPPVKKNMLGMGLPVIAKV
jgi:hypothetical protein